MDNKHKLPLILGTTFSSILLLVVLLVCFCRRRPVKNGFTDEEANVDETTKQAEEKEDLIKFKGGEDLNAYDILDAAGEVIGKSSYGTVYRASLLTSNRLMLLRFLRPTCCSGGLNQVEALIQVLGSIRHPNLVPLSAFYAGPRGEKLLVFPFYAHGNLAEFIRGNDASCVTSLIHILYWFFCLNIIWHYSICCLFST